MKSKPTPAPPIEAEPDPAAVADPAPAPVVGVLTALREFWPSPETKAFSASMARNASVMLNHVRDRVSEALHMLEQLKFDAERASDTGGVEFVTNLIARLQ
jgi:hypothetical protein